jgi:hypothetical protein
VLPLALWAHDLVLKIFRDIAMLSVPPPPLFSISCADQAKCDNLQYFWADICCINKRITPSYPRQSIPCSTGIRTRLDAIYTYWMSRLLALKRITSSLTSGQLSGQVDGLHEAGLSKNWLFERNPSDIMFLPVSILFGYFLGLIKLYALVTLNMVYISLQFNSTIVSSNTLCCRHHGEGFALHSLQYTTIPIPRPVRRAACRGISRNTWLRTEQSGR